MYFIEAAKNFYAYLFEGRCRRHGRDLVTVAVNNHCASTMPVCVECHPQYKDRVILEPLPARTHNRLVMEPLQTATPELAEVEVG